MTFDDGRTIPAWDGLLLDVAARQVAGGCRPDFEEGVADECRKCLATRAAEQTHVAGARSLLEDICQSASHDVDRFDGAIVTVMRELQRRGEVSQDFARDAMWG